MLEINPSYQAVFARLGLDSFEAVSRFFLGDTPSRQNTVLIRRGGRALPDGQRLDVFYKQYEFASPSWRFLGRPSKARREFHNYAVFARLGIPCAEPVACGEQRDALDRLRRAFIVTRTISDARTLLEFCEQIAVDQPRRAQAIRRGLARQLADLTRRIHDAHFHHRDLVWRNILVTAEPGIEPKLWWVDCPRGGFDSWSPLRWRKRVKDLASLDKSAARYCTAGERLAFVRAYLRKPQLDTEAKALAAAVLEYRRRRWPEEGEGTEA